MFSQHMMINHAVYNTLVYANIFLAQLEALTLRLMKFKTCVLLYTTAIGFKMIYSKQYDICNIS